MEGGRLGQTCAPTCCAPAPAFSLQTDYFHLFICVAIVVIYGDDVIEQQLATDQMLLHFGNLAMHMNGELVLRKVNACVLMWAEPQVRDMTQSVEKIKDRCSIFRTSCIPVCPEPGVQDAAVGLETSFAETRGGCRAREAAVWVGSRCTLRAM